MTTITAINGLQPAPGVGISQDAPVAPTAPTPVSSPNVVTDTVQISPEAQALSATGALMADSTPVATLTIAQAIALYKKTPAAAAVQIKDTSANIARNLDALQNLGDKIVGITQSGTVSPLIITKNQLTSAAATLDKIQGSYSLAVTQVGVADANSVLSDSRVVGIYVADSSANISSSLDDLQALGTKVRTITQTGTKSALSVNVAQITSYATTLAKIDGGKYTLNVSDTQDTITSELTKLRGLGTKLASIKLTSGSGEFAVSMLQFSTFGTTLAKVEGGTMAITDTTANVFKGLGGLQTLSAKISGITLSDSGVTAAITAKGLAASMTALGKISGDYKMAVTDTGASIAANIDTLKSLDGHIASIKQTDPRNAIAITAAQYASAATTLGKINAGTYSVSLSEVGRSDLAGLSGDTKVVAMALRITDGDLTGLSDNRIKSIALSGASLTQAATAAADARVKTIAVSDTGANFTSANVNALYNASKANLARITKVEATDATRQTLTVAVADYQKYLPTFLTKFGNMALEVDFTGSKIKGHESWTGVDTMNYYKTIANTNGTFTIQQWDGVSKWANFATLRGGVNFMKFADKTTFLDTGDKNLNALLNVGTQNWMQNPSNPRASTSSTELTKGVYALNNNSTRTTIKYSFFTDQSQISSVRDGYGFQAMSDTQKAAVYEALNYYSSLINVTFQMVDDPAAADIRFGTNNQGSSSGAYATGSNSTNGGVNVLLNNAGSSGTVNADMTLGGYGWETLIHEIGHTLGLKHPGNYNAAGGGTPGPYLSRADDNRRTTVMSYNNAADSFNWQSLGNGTYRGSAINPSTLMPEDILALQFLYGRNTTGASSSENPGDNRTLANFQTTTFDNNWLGMETIAAANGGASLDLSSVSQSNILDLRAGAYSSINVKDATFNSNVGSVKQGFFNLNNVGLAYASKISSVLGGSGTDVFYATHSNAILDGSSGNDKLMLYGAAADWTLNVDTNTGDSVYTNKDGTQITGRNIETVAYYNEAKTATLHSRLDLTA